MSCACAKEQVARMNIIIAIFFITEYFYLQQSFLRIKIALKMLINICLIFCMIF